VMDRPDRSLRNHPDRSWRPKMSRGLPTKGGHISIGMFHHLIGASKSDVLM
jgi:hypothetical protein